MSFADLRGPLGKTARWLPIGPASYGFAVLAVAAATLVRFTLDITLGPFPPFVIFVPAIILVAVWAGFWPGFLATILSSSSVALFFWPSLNAFGPTRAREIVGLILFSFVGTGITALATFYRHHDARMRGFERVIENLEEMITVVDRDYRHLIANRAFLSYQGMKKEDVIGRQASEILAPGVFQATVKDKLDECFQGKVVQYEMSEQYPDRGERNLLISYFPIAGPSGVDRVTCMLQDITDRKKSEAALRESEDRYRDLVEHTEDLLCTHDLKGNLISVNPAPARLLGYEVAELLAIPMRELIAPEFRDQFAIYLQRIKANREDNGLLCVVSRSGERRMWEYRNTLRTEGVAEPIVRGMAHDVTERMRAEEAVRASEEQYRTLFEKSMAGVALSSRDGTVLDCNMAWARMLGYSSPDEVRGRRAAEFYFEPADREPARSDLFQHGCVSAREIRLRRKDGTPVWIMYDSTIRPAGNGGVQVMQATAIEITQRKRAEDALKASEAHFRILVEQASDGIFVVDQQGQFVDVNTAGAEMLGYTREEVLRLGISDVIAAAEVERIMPEIARAARGAPVRSEWTVRRNDGSFFPGEVSSKQLPDGRLQGILRDVTERKQAEEAMLRNEERFRVALKDSPITVFNQDQDLRYTWIYNPQLHWQHDVVGKTDEEILGPKKAAKLTDLKRRVLTTGTPLREEVAVKNNGKSFAFDMSIEPLFGANGEVVGITGSCTDIVRLREMADGLQDAKDRLAQEKSYLESEIQTELGFEQIIGQSPALREVLKKARVVAPTDSTVLLLGETGTGKELVARSVHELSSRHDKTFVKLNCAAVPSGLLESELFGHEKGAFTGAVNQKVGRIELADKGTLFLDEIGELPPELQPKLLRVLQDREFERLGGVQTLHVDVRIIAATNRDLQQDIAEKKFREDLFYRLNVFPIQLPPLRSRRLDIPVLIHHFVDKHAAKMGKHIEEIPDETMQVLQAWNWPGNIRELENMIERMVILTKGRVLAHPPAELSAADCLEEDNLTVMEREHIIRILRETHGVLSGTDGAASRLGVKRTTLQSMLKRFGIEPHEYRRGTGTFGRP